MKDRLDTSMVKLGLVATRSQAESYIKLGKVKVNGKIIDRAGYQVRPEDKIELLQKEQYVSRAALKLASVAEKFALEFDGKNVLDVGSSTGGFTQFALKNGAKKVIAVEVGTNQMHPTLRSDTRIELYEKTDIRDIKLSEVPDMVLMDVSFISLRQVLPAVAKLANNSTQIVAMLKPQFEAGSKDVNKGVIKNDKIRRQILKDFEDWSRGQFLIVDKADSEVEGAKGNRERFYLLKKQ